MIKRYVFISFFYFIVLFNQLLAKKISLNLNKDVKGSSATPKLNVQHLVNDLILKDEQINEVTKSRDKYKMATKILAPVAVALATLLAAGTALSIYNHKRGQSPFSLSNLFSGEQDEGSKKSSKGAGGPEGKSTLDSGDSDGADKNLLGSDGEDQGFVDYFGNLDPNLFSDELTADSQNTVSEDPSSSGDTNNN